MPIESPRCAYLRRKEYTEGHGTVVVLLELVINLVSDPSIPSSTMGRNPGPRGFEGPL